jgi:hypothetical protein
MAWIKSIWRLIVLFFYRPAPASPAEAAPPLEPALPVETAPPPPLIEPEPAPPLPIMRPPPEAEFLPTRRARWVKPKGERPKPSPSIAEPKPKAPAQPRPKPQRVAAENDPEQWGQYYFRDAILDQLDNYWIYLRRMKNGDGDSYDLLKQVGIQLVPPSATKRFDQWREGGTLTELSPWWLKNLPAFGAVAYGFDDVAKHADDALVGDTRNERRGNRFDAEDSEALRNRPGLFTPSSYRYDKKEMDRPAIWWTPRFLYFTKYKRPPADVQPVEGGHVYLMTVYWDRADKAPSKAWKKRRGGVPQTYATWVDPRGKVHVIKSRISERVELKHWSKGPRGGKGVGKICFTYSRWMIPDRYLNWAHRPLGYVEPEEYLRRLFIEAASLYESAALGSMVRVAVGKNDLTAVFGVEIKRTPYFFKDRDIVLNDKGTRKRIFHIVRPHVRKDGTAVEMHFRGETDFTWAGYHVSITVPGRDHFPVPEFNIAAIDSDRWEKADGRPVHNKEMARKLNAWIEQGLGGSK